MKPSRTYLWAIVLIVLVALALMWRSVDRTMNDQQRELFAPFLEAKSLALLRMTRFALDGEVLEVEEIGVDDPSAMVSVKGAIKDMVEASNRPRWGLMLTTFMPEYGIRVKTAAGVHDLHIAPSWYAVVYLNDRMMGSINFSTPAPMERWLFGDDQPDLSSIEQLLRSAKMPD